MSSGFLLLIKIKNVSVKLLVRSIVWVLILFCCRKIGMMCYESMTSRRNDVEKYFVMTTKWYLRHPWKRRFNYATEINLCNLLFCFNFHPFLTGNALGGV